MEAKRTDKKQNEEMSKEEKSREQKIKEQKRTPKKREEQRKEQKRTKKKTKEVKRTEQKVVPFITLPICPCKEHKQYTTGCNQSLPPQVKVNLYMNRKITQTPAAAHQH